MSRIVDRMARWLQRITTASGRHRAGRPPAGRLRFPSTRPSERSTPPRPSIASTVRHGYEPLDGTATPIVRPYLTAYEREETVRLQRWRRDVLSLAAYGIDLDTRDIHACLGAAS